MRKLETIFGEPLKLVPRYQFEKAVKQYRGDRYVKSYTTWQQCITILFSQIKQKDSIRDIVTGIGAYESRWYHLGLSGVHRSVFSDANNKMKMASGSLPAPSPISIASLPDSIRFPEKGSATIRQSS